MADIKTEQETRALAALYQCCAQITRVANTGFWDENAAAAVIRAVGITDPKTVNDIYTADSLKVGFGLTAKIFSGSSAFKREQDPLELLETMSLGNKIMGLSAALTSRDKVYNELSRLIDTFHDRMVAENPGFFNGEKPAVLRYDVIKECATIYQSLISPNFPRLMIPGVPACLSVNENQDKIRALLLAAIRAYVLWEQLGYSRLLLWFHRGRIARCASEHI